MGSIKTILSISGASAARTDQVYSNTARKKLEFTREYNANAVQKYNNSRKQLTEEEKLHHPAVGMLKVQLIPLHLLVQKAFFASKARMA